MGTLNINIEDLGPMGDGIHTGSQGRLYVERALPDDHLKVRTYKDTMGIFRGEILEIVEPSPFRISAPCPHYDDCGGCTAQHLNQKFYQQWKLKIVKDAFLKVGLRPKAWLEPVFLGAGNRRRATFSARKSRGQSVMGYFKRRTDQITDIETCLIADSKLLNLKNTLKPFLGILLKEEAPTDIFLQLLGESVDMLVTGDINSAVLKDIFKTGNFSRIGWRASEKEGIIFINHEQVIAEFGRLKVGLPPLAFLQPTKEGEQALVSAVLKALPSKSKSADLFSGCGTFTGPLLAKGPVDAYEANPNAVSALTKATKENPLRVFKRDLYRNPLRKEELNRYDAVVFDPPRPGCVEQATEMASARTRLLVGVSCNPATFARDARILCAGGYWLQSVQVFDQFHLSHHVEMVGVFTKQKRRT